MPRKYARDMSDIRMASFHSNADGQLDTWRLFPRNHYSQPIMYRTSKTQLQDRKVCQFANWRLSLRQAAWDLQAAQGDTGWHGSVDVCEKKHYSATRSRTLCLDTESKQQIQIGENDNDSITNRGSGSLAQSRRHALCTQLRLTRS